MPNIFKTMGRRAQRVSLIVAMLVVAPCASLFVATPASAAYSCAYPRACIYDGLNGSGTRWSFTGAPGQCVNVTTQANANDKAESYYNNHTQHVSFYENLNCQGHRMQSPLQPVAPNSGNNIPYICLEQPVIECRNKLTSIFFHNG